MIGANITVDKAAIAETVGFFEFVGGQTTDAVRIAINRAAPKVRTLSSSAIRSQVRLSASYVGGNLTVKKATRTDLSGAIRTPSRGILLTRFSTDSQIASDKLSWIVPPDEPARGIRVKVKPTGGTQVVDGKPGEIEGKPFYTVLPKSHALAIAGRRVTPGKKGGKIKVFYGPSLSQVFNTVRDDVLPEAGQIYQAELLDAMRYILAKKFPAE